MGKNESESMEGVYYTLDEAVRWIDPADGLDIPVVRLLKALQSGDLFATGKPVNNGPNNSSNRRSSARERLGRREEIRDYMWADLNISADGSDSGLLCVLEMHDDGHWHPAWRDVRLLRRDVKAFWKPRGQAEHSAAESSPVGGATAEYLEPIVSAHNLEGFRDIFWNLGQVVAWVETRSPFPVDALSETKHLTKREHSMPSGLPHFATEVAEELADANGIVKRASPFRSIAEARNEVLRSFQSGLLIAFAKPPGSMELAQITPLEWANLTFDDNDKGPMSVRHRDGWRQVWRDVQVKGSDVINAFPVLKSQSASASTTRGRRGRAPKYDWEDAMAYAIRQLEDNGDFSEEQNRVAGWRSQADLVRLVIAYMGKHNEQEPAESDVKRRVKATLDEWRGNRANPGTF